MPADADSAIRGQLVVVVDSPDGVAAVLPDRLDEIAGAPWDRIVDAVRAANAARDARETKPVEPGADPTSPVDQPDDGWSFDAATQAGPVPAAEAGLGIGWAPATAAVPTVEKAKPVRLRWLRRGHWFKPRRTGRDLPPPGHAPAGGFPGGGAPDGPPPLPAINFWD